MRRPVGSVSPDPASTIPGRERRPALGVSILCVALAGVLCGCATRPADPAAQAAYDEANDPLEPMNRQVFRVNEAVDSALFKPAAETYRTVVPEIARTAVRNMLNNLGEPVIFANNLLQGEFRRAGVSFNRFLFNSTVGLAGMIDFAGDHGWARENGDFGQTLYSWGIDAGPYLMLPILGPSSPRDALGSAVDSYADPFRYILTNVDPDASTLESPNVARSTVDGVDKRAGTIDELDTVKKDAVDFYAELRSLYRQNRAQELRHGSPAPAAPATDLYSDPAAN
jgi:phospholipid-binding lipoprotein MlaA